VKPVFPDKMAGQGRRVGQGLRELTLITLGASTCCVVTPVKMDILVEREKRETKVHKDSLETWPKTP